MLQEIDSLEKQYVMEKMGELSLRSCSIQSRKPVRSIGHSHDLQVKPALHLPVYQCLKMKISKADLIRIYLHIEIVPVPVFYLICLKSCVQNKISYRRANFILEPTVPVALVFHAMPAVTGTVRYRY
jgi:hypothetical protein